MIPAPESLTPGPLHYEPREDAMVIRLALAALLGFLGPLVLGGATALAGPPPAYYVDESKLPFDALPGTSTTRHWGVSGGAGYRIEVPDDWNGDLVLYAHGFRGTGLELTVSNPRIREYLVTHGYAWAASSYSTNGYDVKQGVKDTHGLGQLFNGLVGNPGRTFITGHSMGGHITGVAIEQYPQSYVGALPMCVVMGDNELFDYFLDFNLVAEALAGVPAQFTFPADYQTAVVPAVKAVLGAPYPSVLTPPGQQLRGVTKNISGGERPAFNTSFFAWANFLFTVGVTGGDLGVAPGNVQDNSDAGYQIDGDPVLSPDETALNAAGLRVGQGRAGGAAAEGAADLLVTRAIRDHNHCGFAVQEEEAAFAALDNWVTNGVKPAGDDILTPASVADPEFGCPFSVPGHAHYPAC